MSARWLVVGLLGLLAVAAGLAWTRPWSPRLPADIADCGDAACRADWIVAAFARDPAEAAAAIQGLPDPIERVAVVSQLTEANLGQTEALCALLPEGPSRSRCEILNRRPHLWTELPRATASVRQRPGGGPDTTILPVPAGATTSFPDEGLGEQACASRPDRSTCLSQAARRQAHAGAYARAARACKTMGVETLASECLFSAAESAVASRGERAYDAAVDLCLASGAFAANCLAHTLSLLAQIGVDATVADPTAWAPLRERALAVRTRWEAKHPEASALYLQRFWSDAMALAYAVTPTVTGGPLAGVPEIAVPHVRAAAAVRLYSLEGPGAHDSLDAWVSALDAALQTRLAEPLPAPQVRLFQGVRDLWPEDLPGEEDFPAIYYLGTARRTVSDDPRADLAICVLEAAGRTSCNKEAPEADRAAARAVLTEGAAHDDERVRFTAERILACRAPVVP